MLSTSSAPPPAYETEGSGEGLGCAGLNVYGSPVALPKGTVMSDETLAVGEDAHGNLEAMEFLLCQLFAMVASAQSGDTQSWLAENTVASALKIAGSAMNAQRKAAAQGTVRRVMQIASHLAAEDGDGEGFGVQ